MPIKVRGMAPMIHVYDIGVSLQFYCDVLDFELINPPEWHGEYLDWALLQWGDIELMLNTICEREDRPAQPDEGRRKRHDLCLYFACDDVDAVYEQLREQGMDIETPHLTNYGMRQLYLSDPDGFNLCFQTPVDGEGT